MLEMFDEAVDVYEQAIDIINDDYNRKIEYNRENTWDTPSDSYLRWLLSEKNGRVSEMEERISDSMRLKEQSSPLPDDERFLKRIGCERLITIAGTQFHDGPEFESKMRLQLVKEPENKFDSDAIAVYFGDVKIGYVANSYSTSCDLTSMSREVDIPGGAYVEYILYYLHRYHIAKILG